MTKNQRRMNQKKLNEKYFPILLRTYGAICWYCGLDLTNKTRVIEHIVPKSRGGTDDWDNLALACHFCNSAKRTMDLEEFYIWLAHIRSSKFKQLFKIGEPHPQSNLHLVNV